MSIMPPMRLDPCCSSCQGTPRVSRLYSSQWRDWVPGSKSHPEGIYVRAGGRVDRSVAAQGAARWSPTAMPTMRAAATARCWRRPRRWRSWRCATGRRTGRPVAYDETIRVGEVDVRFVPAGHVLGSAQIVLEHKGERVVVSGDYKRRPDPTCPPLRAGAVRHLHHRGDLRPAGVPPSRHRQRDRPAAPPAACRPEPLRAGRRLCAGQGAADHHRAARARPPRRRSISTARSSG